MVALVPAEPAKLDDLAQSILARFVLGRAYGRLAPCRVDKRPDDGGRELSPDAPLPQRSRVFVAEYNVGMVANVIEGDASLGRVVFRTSFTCSSRPGKGVSRFPSPFLRPQPLR